MFTALKFAIRSLLKTPGFTLIAIVTLALGLGLNTSMFSLVNITLLRPLPFPRSEQLVRLQRTTAKETSNGFAPDDFLDLKHAESAFGRFAGYANMSVSVSEPGRPAEVQDAQRVSADYLEVLQIRPELGRNFRPAEEIQGNHRVVILSHPFWQARFGGDPGIIRHTIRIDGVEHAIIGILPASANDGRLIRGTGLLLPLSFSHEERASRTNQWVSILGRRAEGVSIAAGDAFVSSFGARLAAEFPNENGGASWQSRSLRDSLTNRNGRSIMAMLLGLSGFVVLIACSNLANFFLARTMARAHELAVRTALGSTRWQLIRPLIMESVVLALAGGASALVVSAWAARWLSTQSVASGGSPLEFPLDWRVLGFATGVSLLTALFFGIVPGLFASRVDVNHTLKSGARGATAARGHQRLRQLLVVGQFAMATILLAGAGFFIRGAGNLAGQQFGANANQVLQGSYELPAGRYPKSENILAFQRRVLERLQQLPGVSAVSASYALPYGGLVGPRQYRVEGREQPAQGQGISASYNGVTPDYFAATDTRSLHGRVFTANDTPTSAKVAIVSESLARHLFGQENPLGRRIAQAEATTPEWTEIVGVVADVASVSIYQKPLLFQVYRPFAQEPWQYSTFAVRTAGIPAETLIGPVRAAITTLDPDLPVSDLMTAPVRVERSSFDLTMLKQMLGAFALLGLLLAALGIYGVIARTVAQRTGEIGIRMALGAQVADIVRLVLGAGLRLALLGAAAGLFGAFGLGRLIASMMPAIQTNGNLVLSGVTLLLVGIALVACYLPARAALKIDPVNALRSE